jgi:hypothetical protein
MISQQLYFSNWCPILKDEKGKESNDSPPWYLNSELRSHPCDAGSSSAASFTCCKAATPA